MRLLVRSVLPPDRFEIVGEAVDAAGAIEAAHTLRPDIVVLDQRMPDATGVEAAHAILSEQPKLLIVLFSAYLTPETIDDATTAGIRLCLSKDRIFDLADQLSELAGAA